MLEKVLLYTVARRLQGAKLIEAAVELAHPLSLWLGEKRPAVRFERADALSHARLRGGTLTHGVR